MGIIPPSILPWKKRKTQPKEEPVIPPPLQGDERHEIHISGKDQYGRSVTETLNITPLTAEALKELMKWDRRKNRCVIGWTPNS